MTATQPRPGSGAMFDGIARRYDLLNRLTSLGLDQSWRAKLAATVAAGVPRGGVVLDLATGTGDVALALADAAPTARVLGIDPSARMLEKAREKVLARVLADRVRLARGDAHHLSLQDGVVDGVSIAFGLRNVPDRARGLREMRRVTRPGGRLCVLELGTPRRGLLGPLARFHIDAVVPRLGAWLSGAREYRYLASSIEAFPPPDEVVAMLTAAGWRDAGFTAMAFDAAHLYVGTA